MNNQIRVVGLLLVGMIFVWGMAAVSAQSIAAPTNLTLVDTNPFDITVSWTDNASDETHYLFEVYHDGELHMPTFVAEADASSFTLDLHECNTSHEIRVQAYRETDDTYSDYSNLLTVSTEACPPPPAAPTNLSVTGTSITSISISWIDNADYETEYVIEVNSDGSWIYGGWTEGNSTSFTIDGLLCNTSYDIRVYASRYYDYSNSDYSEVLTASTDVCPPPPTAPSDFHLISTTQFSLTFGWTDNSSDEIYFVMENQLPDLSWAAAYTPANTTSVKRSALSCNTSYTFRLASYGHGGTSAYTEPISVTTNACANPIAPSNLTQTGNTQTSVSLSWTDNELDETNYRVERSTDGTNWTQVTSLSANTTSYTVSSLACSNSYYFRVRAYRTAGNVYSPYSNVLQASTVACTPPAAPTNLAVTGSGIFTVSLSWTDNATNEGAFYIERSSDGGTSWAFAWQVSANSTSYTLTSENCNSNLQYRIRARLMTSTTVFSDYSNVVSAVTGACPPVPAAPTNFMITGSSGNSVSFSWLDNADTETTYRIDRSSNGGTSWVHIASVGANITSYTNSTMSCEVSYLYRVYAHRSGDNVVSAYSDTIQLTFIACNPFSPSSLVSPSKTSTTIDLTWNDISSTESGYRIERSADGGTSWTEIAQVPANTTTYQATGLNCETNYRFRVRAYRSSNNLYSGYSTSGTITTSACVLLAPTNFRVTHIYLNAIEIAWNDTNGSESAYRMEKSLDGGLSWSSNISTNPNVTNVLLSATCTSNLLLRVYAYRSSDNTSSPYSQVLDATIAPCAPSLVLYPPRTATSITVTWSDFAINETEYRVRRYNGVSYDLIATLPANSTSYEDTGLNCETAYLYNVQAYRSGDNQISGDGATIYSGYCPLQAVTLNMVSTGLTSVSLSWVDTNATEDTQRLERSSDNGATWTFVQWVTYATSHTVTGLQCEKTYSFRVITYRTEDSASATSNNVAGTTTACPPPPNAPSNLTITASSYTEVDLSWSDNSNNEQYFAVEKSIDGGLNWLLISDTLRVDRNYYTATGLSCGTSYAFRVYARQTSPGDLVSNYSNIVTVSTWACPILNAPTNFGATFPNPFSLNLMWNENSVGEDGFAVQMSSNGGVSYGIGYSYTSGTSLLISGLDCNKSYTFRVRAFNNEVPMISEWAYLTVSTSACPPPPNAPSNLTAIALSQTQIQISWTDNSTDEEKFRLERSTDGVNFIIWGYVGPNQTSAANAGTLPCGTMYYFRIYATSHNLVSDSSNIATASTLPCSPSAPANFTATSTGMHSISLSWQDTMSDETAFYLERSLNGGSSWESPIQLAANTTSYADTGLTCGTSYTYRLRAYRSGDNVYSSYTSNRTTSTSACPARPTTPSNVERTIISPTEILLTWDDNATTETNYRIERSTDPNGLIWNTIADLGANAESYNDTTIECGKSYRYRVMAYIAVYNVFSWDAMSTQVDTLCAPILSYESNSNWSITMSWGEVSSAHDYAIDRSSDGGLTWQTVHETEYGETTYRDASLDCGMTYKYRVRAYDTFDEAYSNPSNVITGSTNPCTLTEATCTFNQLDLSSYSVDTLGPVYMSGDGSRVAFNYYDDTVDMYPDGLYLYDIAAESVLANFPNAAFGDINHDGRRMVFMSSDNPLGQNADGGEEIFYWNNGTLSQLTNTSLATGVGQPHMSDDGSIVVFWADGDVVGDATAGSFVYIWDATNGIRKLIPQAYGANAADLDIAISGDGSTVVFEHSKSLSGLSGLGNVQLYRWNAVDGLQLVHPYQHPQSYEGLLMSVMVNEDGSRIVFMDSNDPLGLNESEEIEIFIWDESTGLSQLTEAEAALLDSWLGSIDASGSRILFISGQNLDTDDSSPIESGVYLYDEDYGFSNIYPATSFGMPVWGTAVSADGLRMAVPLWVDYPGTGNGWSYVEIFIVDCTPANHLPAPDALSAESDGATSIDLSWTDHSLGENDYRIERSSDGTNWTEIAQLAANSTSYSDSGLDCETAYQYRVRGYRDWDEHYSDYSNVAVESSALTCVDAPTALTITGTTQTSVSLSWTDNASDETNYSLERSADGVNWVVIQALAANTSSFTDLTTVCNTTYDYRVRAYRSADSLYSSYSNVATGTTSACPPPAAPTGLTLNSVGYTNINLSWTDNAGDETSYSLERSADSGASWSEITQAAANATSYNDTSVTCNTSYEYRVRAYRAGDSQFSAYSNIVTGTSDICITLNAPTNIQQTANTQTGMSLSWTDNSTNESGYEIERSLDGTNWTLLSSLPANSTSYTDSGLTCSTGYHYRIRSHHLGTATYSPYGSSGVLSTASCPALIPSVLSSTGATQNSISLSWTVDTNATSFTLAYYNGTSWVNLGIFPSTTTSYTHTGLSCNTSYQYQVTTFRVTDSASVTSSAFSTSTSACPPLNAPNAPIVVNTEPALVSLQIPALPATATSMSLERSTDGLSWANLGNVSTNYLDTAVVCGSSYQYRLVATRSSDGVTSTSTNAVAVTDACPIPNVVGVYRAGLWVFVDSNNTATPVNSFNFGDSSWQALVGDWDGDGIDGVGIYRNGEFALRNVASADSPENRFNFGNAEAGWQALVGDWNGDGIDSVGLYKDGLFILSDDNLNMNYRFNFGYLQAGWQVLAGDWDGNGADGIALYKEGFWMLANDVNNPDASSFSVSYGPAQAGWTAIVGDWNGDGQDSIGLYANGIWRMRVNSVNDATETSLNFGQTGDIPLAIFEN